jgi:phenylacetate-CoA ligase
MSKLGEVLRLNVILPIAEKLMGLRSMHWYNQIREMNTWTKQQIIDWQNQQLRAFVRHAYEHTVYYKEVFDQLNLTPDDIQCAEDLKKLPVLTKDIVRARFDDLVPNNINQYRHRKEKTGGTSGDPMIYLCSEDTWGFVTAMKMHSWRTTSYRYGDKFAALGSASLFKKKASLPRRIYDWIRQEYPLNSMNLSNELCQEYIDKMRREGINYIYGYASAIYLLAKYAHDNKVDVSFIKGAYRTSENLTPTYRAMIERTFGCRVMDCYGCRDAGVACYEVKPGEYHLGYASILEVEGANEEGIGVAVSTNVLNYAFPLLRYDYGDMVQLKEQPYEYNGQVISQILGRKSDVLQLDNGHVLTSPGFTILMNKFDVVAYDIQKISGSAIKMLVQPVEGKWNTEQEKLLTNEMKRFVGEGCEFTLEYVDHFEPLKNGKRRYFMNDLSDC